MDRKKANKHLENVSDFLCRSNHQPVKILTLATVGQAHHPANQEATNDTPGQLAARACFGIPYRVRSAYAPFPMGSWRQQASDREWSLIKALKEAALNHPRI